MGNIKGQSSGSNKKYHHDDSKEGKDMGKGMVNKITTTAHQFKDLKNHCNINGHAKDKFWKLHPNLNPKNHKKDAKKKNMLAMNSSNQ